MNLLKLFIKKPEEKEVPAGKDQTDELLKRIELLEKNVASLRRENEDLRKEAQRVEKKQAEPELTEEQKTVFYLMENTPFNYFITGKAGTGKSTVLKYFMKHTKKKNVVVLASTGIAAVNVGGQTIHSFFRMNIGLQDTKNRASVIVPPGQKDIIAKTDMIIIDEISMVRADVMNMIDAKLKYCKNNQHPFGGCQVIAFGDICQLPPIVKDNAENLYIDEFFKTPHFYGANVTKTMTVVEMKNVLRQTDNEFIRFLNNVREGKVSDSELNTFNSKCIASVEKKYACPRIVLTNKRAAEINMNELSMLPSEMRVFEATIGDNAIQNGWDFPCEQTLSLKKGASVIIIVNDMERRYVNGTTGIVKEISDEAITVKCGTETFAIEKFVWEKRTYTYDHQTHNIKSEVTGWVKQFPLKLAYAITVHKSQGQTYNEVMIDFGEREAFASGQAYVALSRCRSLNGIHLSRPLKQKDIIIDRDAIEYLHKNSYSPKQAKEFIEIPF